MLLALPAHNMLNDYIPLIAFERLRIKYTVHASFRYLRARIALPRQRERCSQIGK